MAAEQEVNIKFVLEVEKYPCLYNYKLPEYVRKDVVDKAWLEIGKKFNLTGAGCKEKWRNIRNVFVRNLKAGKSGSGARKKKPYYLNEVMQFTLPFIKLSHASISENLPTVMNPMLNTEDNDEDDNILLFVQQSSASQLKTAGDSQSMQYYHNTSPSRQEQTPSPQSSAVSLRTSSPQSRPEPTPSPSPSDLSSTCKKKSRKTKSSVGEEIHEYFKSKQARKETCLEQQPKKMFLLSLLPDVESMSERQMRAFKTRVTQLIEDILEDQPSTSAAENPEVSLYYENIGQVNTHNIKKDIE